MLRPSASRTNRMARLVMRTHAVPMPANAKGSTASATAINAMPIHAPCGCFFGSRRACMPALRAFADALAQKARRPEDEDREQHQKRKHVLVGAAGERAIG